MYPGNEIVLKLCISLAVLYICHSLVPRPFPPPVFHHFQYEILAVGTAWERDCTCLSLNIAYSIPFHHLIIPLQLNVFLGHSKLHVCLGGSCEIFQ